jgi:hypothetical protein
MAKSSAFIDIEGNFWTTQGLELTIDIIQKYEIIMLESLQKLQDLGFNEDVQNIINFNEIMKNLIANNINIKELPKY